MASRASRKARKSRDRAHRIERPGEPRAEARAAGRLRWVVPFAIAVLTVLMFLPVLRAGFVAYDDPENFLQNPYYRGLGVSELRWMWTTTHLGHYVPLSWMTLGLDYVLWGMNPSGYHAVNLLLHAANAVMLFFLARRVFRVAGIERQGDGVAALAPAAFAALVFAVHPLRVESVAWITERRDMVALAFSLASVLWYLRSIDDTGAGSRSRRWYWLAVASFVCALLSKATAVTLPATLFVLNVYPFRRIGGAAGWWTASARQALRELAPFGAASLLAGLGSIVALQPGVQLVAIDKVAVSAYSLGFYLWKTVVPTHLAPLYERRLPIPGLSPAFLATYVVAALFVASAWFARRRFPGLTAAFVAFGVAIFPLLGFVQNGPQIAADRYTYHAAPALAIVAGAGLAMLMRRWSPRGAMTLGATIIIAFAALTWRQTGVWHDSKTLWSRVLEIEPDSPLGHSAWANILYGQNRIDEAMEHSARAIEAAPGFAEGHNDLGVGFAKIGRIPEAVSRYQEALALKPGFDEAEANWGIVLAQQGQLDSAIAHFRRALAANPDNANAEVNWGNALVRGGRTDEAIEHYRRALWIRPDLADAELNWGVALARQGRYAEAVTHFEKTLQLDSAHAEAREYLARARQLLQAPPPAR